MCNRCKCKQKSVKVIRVKKHDFDYNKLAKAIVKAKTLADRKIKEETKNKISVKVAKVVLIIFSVLSAVIYFLGLILHFCNVQFGLLFMIFALLLFLIASTVYIGAKTPREDIVLSGIGILISILTLFVTMFFNV